MFKEKIKEISKLALPIVISFVAIGLMGIVDTIIVGNYDTNELAYMGLANSIFIVLFTIPIALLQGVMIKSSQKYGAKKFASCGKIYNEGKKYLIWLSIIFTCIGLLGKYLLIPLGHNPVMASESGFLLIILSCSIPFILINTNAAFFLQSIKRPHIAMYAAIIANILNIIINPILVFGKFGAPELGATGAAITTVVIRIFMAWFSIAYVGKMKKTPKLSKRFGLDRNYITWWNDSKTTRKIGFGAAITTIAVNGSFSLSSTFAGWMGEHSMATYVIITTVSGILFMILYSISQATSMIAANDYGRKDLPSIVTTALAGLTVLLLSLIALLTVLVSFPDTIFRTFSSDETVIWAASSLVFILAYETVVDSIPMNFTGVLYGRGDVKIPTIIQIISYLGVRTIACYILAFKFDMGLKGILIGLSLGGICSLTANSIRFAYLSYKDKKTA